MTTSEDRYWIAKDLYQKIKENFYDIENEEAANEDELIQQTIDDAEEALENADKINVKVLKKHFPANIYVLTKNINKFKEQADYVLMALKKMKDHKEDKPKKQRNPLPPEMWPDKERKEHEKQLRKRREGGIPDTKTEFDIMGESFISLAEYKKAREQGAQEAAKALFESMAYYCRTCGDRAEHEEIEENPNKKCGNCGDSDWADENSYEADKEDK